MGEKIRVRVSLLFDQAAAVEIAQLGKDGKCLPAVHRSNRDAPFAWFAVRREWQGWQIFKLGPQRVETRRDFLCVISRSVWISEKADG